MGVEDTLARVEERLNSLGSDVAEVKALARELRTLREDQIRLSERVDNTRRDVSGQREALVLLQEKTIKPLVQDVNRAIGGRSVLITLFCVFGALMAGGAYMVTINSVTARGQIQDQQKKIEALENQIQDLKAQQSLNGGTK